MQNKSPVLKVDLIGGYYILPKLDLSNKRISIEEWCQSRPLLPVSIQEFCEEHSKYKY